jgi:phage-related holin
VLNHLKKEPLTPLVALRKYGTLRLAALVFNLKNEGHNIVTDRVNVGSKNKPKLVAQYTLIKNKK